MLRLRLSSIGAAIMLTIAGGVAQASGVHIEDFGTGAPGGVPDPYVNGGYSWSPVTPDNSVHCYSGICLHEAGQQALLSNTTTDPAGGVFDLLGFHVDLTGNGNDDGNFLSISGYLGGVLQNTLTFAIDVATGAWVDPSGNASLYDRDGNPVAPPITPHGGTANARFILIENDFMDGIDALSWQALGSANVRIDCVALSMPSGVHEIEISDISSCSPAEVPIPASLPLLATGLLIGGGIALRRRRVAT